MKPIFSHLIAEISFKTSRSGGSGGQHVNKVSSKVELNFDVLNSKVLTEDQKSRIKSKLESRINTDGILQVVCQEGRSQFGNKKRTIEKFRELIDSCFLVVKKRKATAVPKAVREKRLVEKKRKAEIKKMRSKI